MFFARMLLISFLFMLTACSHLPLGEHADSSLAAHAVSGIDTSSVYAANRDGSRIALGNSGLIVIYAAGDQRQHLDDSQPVHLAWSPEATELAALFESQAGSLLKLFNTNGNVIEETVVPGKAQALFWVSNQELIILTSRLSEHRFGTSLTQLLYRWKRGEAPISSVLHDTTIVPLSLKRYGQAQLLGQFPPQLSPFRDELLYARLFNPPVSPPYFKLYVRNLSSGVEQELVKLGIDGGSAQFSHDGEEAVWNDGDKNFWQQRLWESGQPRRLSYRGSALMLSRNADMTIVDGRIIYNNRQLGELPKNSSAVFMEGERLLVSWNNTLFVLEGLPATSGHESYSEKQVEQLKAVRAWRSSGTITSSEYNDAVTRILKK